MEPELFKIIAAALEKFNPKKSFILLSVFLFTVIIFNADKIATLIETVAKLTR